MNVCTMPLSLPRSKFKIVSTQVRPRAIETAHDFILRVSNEGQVKLCKSSFLGRVESL